MGEDSGEKTEEPTPHKLQEARKKGQTAKSKDLTSVFLLIVAYFSLKLFAGYIYGHFESVFFLAFDYIAADFNESVAVYLLGQTLTYIVYILIPLFGINLIVAVVAEYSQVGPIFSFEQMKPDLNKLNPIEGVKKLFSMKQVVELIKSILKMAVVIFIIYSVLREDIVFVLLAQELTPFQVVTIAGSLMFKIVIRVCIFYFIIAVLDYFYQRYEFIKSLKMSIKEIKDEYKKLEGDPIIKQRQREAQMQMSQGRQMGAVPDADVVVTNPIHVAIAIQYVPNKMKAPKILAKGKRMIAAEIKQLAERHFIPIVENPPLARDLYKYTEPGSDVPPMYYKAVAEILAFVFKLKKKKKVRY